MTIPKKILIPVLLVILIGGYEGYSMATAPPPPKPCAGAPAHWAKNCIHVQGQIYVMPGNFTLNMAGGQYATLQVALLLSPTQAMAATDPANPPPTGYGDLPEEAIVRAIITNAITGQPAAALTTAAGRAKMQAQILAQIQRQTDVMVMKVLFPNVAVQ